MEFGLGLQIGQVEQLAVAPGVQVDSIVRVAECKPQQKGEEDAKQSRRQNAAMLHAALYQKGI